MVLVCIKVIFVKLRLMWRLWNLDVLIIKERYVWNVGIYILMVLFVES